MFPNCSHDLHDVHRGEARVFVPLSSIETRLFSAPLDKSVKFSAEGFM